MDIMQIIVTAGGIGLIGFTLWFFFGTSKTSRPKERSSSPYICPMHPWIGSDDPTADCSLCGMKLVRNDKN
jgi:hypothetical protein